jgi:hypothetical protein
MDEYFDWYDYDKVQELHDKRCEKYMDLIRDWRDAKEKGNVKTLERASKAMSKYRVETEKLKEKASLCGFYWY